MRFADRVGRSAVGTAKAAQALRKLERETERFSRRAQGLPDSSRELERGQVLGQVVEAAQEAHGLAQCGERCPSEAGGDAEPILLTDADMNPIVMLNEVYGDGSSAS